MCQHFLLYKSYTGLWDESGLAEWLIQFLARSPLPGTAELFQGLNAPLSCQMIKMQNVFMHAKSSCLNAWPNSTLGGCDRNIPGRPSQQTLDAHMFWPTNVRLSCACMCTFCTHIQSHKWGGGTWALGCFGPPRLNS